MAIINWEGGELILICVSSNIVVLQWNDQDMFAYDAVKKHATSTYVAKQRPAVLASHFV